MKTAISLMSFALTLGVSGLFAADQTWTGQISDSMCGADHSMMEHGGKKMSARECTAACIKGGAKYVFVTKGKVYEIQNQDRKDLADHAGHTVKMSGKMSADGKTVTVDKIEMPGGKKS